MAGQYFRVYLEYWNQECNWADAAYVDTFVDIQVITAPPAPTASSSTICSGGDRTLTVSSTPVGTLKWYSDAGLSIPAVGTFPTATTFVQTATAAGVYNYWVVDQSATGLMCMSPSTPVTLTIREALTQPGAISGPAQVCSSSTGNVFSVIATPPTEPIGGATQYIWVVPGGWTITAGQGTNSITVTAGTITGAQTISMTDQYITAPICPSTAQTFATNLNPVATINSASTGYACSGSLYTYTATSGTVGCTFAWTRDVVAGISNGAGSGSTATISETLNNTTTSPVNVIYLITPTINGCAGTTFTLTVTVNPTGEADQPSNQTLCIGATGTVTFTTTDGGAGVSSYAWTNSNTGIGLAASGTGNISFTTTNATTAPITGTIAVTPTYTYGGTGCAGTAKTFTITVNPTGQVTQPADLYVCNTGTGTVTFATTNTGAGTTTYAWTNSNTGIGLGASGAGNISFTATNAGTGPISGTIAVTPTYTYGGTSCTGTAKTFTIYVNPTGLVTQPADLYVCNTGTGTVTFATTNTGAGTTTYAWTNSNTGIGLGASGAGNISFTATNAGTGPISGTIAVTPTYTYGGTSCTGTAKTFTIYVNPTGLVTQPANLYVCNTGTGTVTFATTNTGAGTTTYAWTNSNTGIGLGASGAGNISFTATNAGTGPITGTIAVTPTYTYGGTSCTGTAKTFTIYVNPTGLVTQPADLYVCNTGTGTVTFATTNTGAGTTTYAWTNSNTGIGLGASGAGNISFTATNAGTGPITGTIAVTPTYTYGGTSCTGTAKTFTIYVNPTGEADQPSNQTLCIGATGTVTFTTTDGGAGVSSYAWTNSNTGIGLAASGTGNISFTTTNATTAPITGTIAVTPTYTYGGTGCAGTAKTFTITVNPTGQVTQPADLYVCNTGTGTVTFATTNTGAGTTTYAWTNSNTGIGLGASGAGNISFTATNAGTGPISGTIAVTPTYTYGGTSCTGTAKTFTIYVNPTGLVTQPADLYVCNTGTGTVTFATTNTGAGTTTYAWTNSNTGIGLGASGAGKSHSQRPMQERDRYRER